MGKIYRYWGPEEGDKEPLHKLPQMSPLRVKLKNGSWEDGVFHHIDGSYSYCTLGKEVPADTRMHQIFHLKAWTPMVYVNGRWQIDEGGDE